MFSPQCVCGFKLFSKLKHTRPISHVLANAVKAVTSQPNFPLQQQQQQQQFSTTQVHKDVLKSRADEFSGARNELIESEEVQSILKRMTTISIDQIFAGRKEALRRPTYNILDSEELKKAEEVNLTEVGQRLKMPEVRELRKPINIIISHDEELIEFDEDGADFVFTDISSLETTRTRLLRVRENATGVLREGNWDERERMEFMYWPKEGQTYETAPMLLDENLPFMFNEGRHCQVLDFINVQWQVDAPDYQRVLNAVYEDLAVREAFHHLKSTRYYGGMVFYFVTNKKTLNVFSSLVQSGDIDDAADIVRLHSLIDSLSLPIHLSNKELVREFIDASSDELGHLLDSFDRTSENTSENTSADHL